MSVKSALKIKLNGQWVALPVMIGDAEVDGVVRYDEAQTLTEEEKALARENIGAGTGGDVEIPNSNLVNGSTAGSLRTTGSYEEGNGSGYMIGEDSFAQGRWTMARGRYAHAEGYFTSAAEDGAHAEGSNTTASGAYSHAEGNETRAQLTGSHAEGLGTNACSPYQHVQGKYNVVDWDERYAHIVGNGSYDYDTGDTLSSNAHTLDWQGNAWYQGVVESAGIILSSPDGTQYKVTVEDGGSLSVQEWGGIELPKPPVDES